jgi:hypothetical protein
MSLDHPELILEPQDGEARGGGRGQHVASLTETKAFKKSARARRKSKCYACVCDPSRGNRLMRKSSSPCENSKNVEKWLAAIELLRFSERAMDEKRRKSTNISRLPLTHLSFHTVCKTFANFRWRNNVNELGLQRI